MENIQAELIGLVVTVLVAMIGFVTKHSVTFLKNKGVVAKLQGNKELVKIVVNAIEQSYKHLHGTEKLNMAKIELVKLLNEKKIKITEKEIDLLIESAVREMKETAKIEISEDTSSNTK